MAVQKKLYTVDDFEAFIARPENRDRLFELIDGEIYEKMPTEEHGVIQLTIGSIIRAFAKQHNLGRTAVEARYRPAGDRRNDRLPDVSFRRVQPNEAIVTRGAVEQMPDLAVEIKSPDDDPDELVKKAEFYLAHGSRLVWLVYPAARTVVVYRTGNSPVTLTDADTLEGYDVLPGFTLPVKDVFEE
jgi:Uma2 family endonuclease